MSRPRTFLALVASGLVVAQSAQAAGPPLLTPARYTHALEGDRAKAVIRLPAPADHAISVRFATRAGTAEANADFKPRRGTLRIRKGARRATIVIGTVEDTVDELTETFTVRLRAPVGARLGSERSTRVKILDNNPALATVATHTIEEPARTGSSVPIGAVVTISGASAGARPVTLGYEVIRVEPTVDGNDADVGSGKLRFAAGETSKVIPGTVKGDALDENDEHLLIVLAGTRGVYVPGPDATITITDDPGDMPPAVSIGDITAPEGIGGAVQVPLTLSAPSERELTVTYTTAPGTADSHDFVATTGTVTFAPDATTAAAPVALVDDLTDEPDQSFTVTLSEPVDVTLSDAEAAVTIADDDPAPSVSIGDGALAEPATSTSLTISLSRASEKPVTVKPTITGGTATVGAACDPMAEVQVDVIALPADLVITIEPGATSAPLNISACDDVLFEATETVLFTLSEPGNALLGDAAGQLNVFDNDA